LQDHGSQVYTSKRKTLHGQHQFSLAGSSNMKRAVSSMDAWGVRQHGGGDEHVARPDPAKTHGKRRAPYKCVDGAEPPTPADVLQR
ncbi:unnamed protein product, partial [Ectocarpus sp. 12 AP-2014]